MCRARRHLAPLDRDRTWVLNLDTVGSPELVMLEGEGCFVMEDYFDRGTNFTPFSLKT